MGEATLVESQISDAIALVKELDVRGDAPTIAAWYLYDDADEWRLVIAGPSFDAVLPTQEQIAYRKIVEAMADLSLQSITVSDVKLLNTRSPIAGVIRLMIRTPPDGIAKAHLYANYVNGIFVKDVFVLRSA